MSGRRGLAATIGPRSGKVAFVDTEGRKTSIAIERVVGNDVRSAVFSALAAIQAEQLMTRRGMIVLLKPNVLMAKPPQQAATTHPAVVQAVIRWVKQFDPAKIFVADSANGISPGNTRRALKVSGIQEVCDEERVVATGFEETPRRLYRVPQPLILKEVLSSSLLGEADLIINLPKIKTHGQCTLTCALKNMFGTVIIGNKTKIHARFPTQDQFSSALADIYSAFRPQLTVVDGTLCQEGKGPASGDVVKLDLILAGCDPVAMDTTVCAVIGLDPQKVLHLRKAEEKGLGTADLGRVRYPAASIEEVRRPFKIPRTAMVPFRVPQPVTDYLAREIFRATVSFRKDRCVRCGTCWQNCPTQAIVPPTQPRDGHTPTWVKSGCIACYCCAETCPHDAVNFKIDILRNLFTTWIGPSFMLLLLTLVWLASLLF